MLGTGSERHIQNTESHLTIAPNLEIGGGGGCLVLPEVVEGVGLFRLGW